MDILGKWVLKAPKLSEPFADVLDDKLWVVAMSQTDEAEITTTIVDANRRGLFYDLYGRVPPLSKQPPKTALCAVPAITLKLFVVIIRAINRQKARYLWLFASKWQSTVQVAFL